MLSSTRRTTGEKTNNHSNKTGCCLHSFSSISSSSSSSSSSSKQYSTFRPTPTSMEEVWKDINLASLPDNSSLSETPPMRLYHPHPSSTANNFRSMILQDFLARPFGKDPHNHNHNHHHRPPTSVDSTSTTHDTTTTLYGPTATASSTLPPPATVLSLNSGPKFHFLDNSDPLPPHDSHLQSDPISNVTSFSCPFEALASSSGLPSFRKKRFPESETGSGSGAGGDRRHKRMIKNRESAARSRARKQAYTNELELEVAHLMEENAKLRRQQEQYCRAAASQLPKKYTLQRTSTAPF